MLASFAAADRRMADRLASRPHTLFAYEFLRFGLKQGWACLFGGSMVALMIGTHFWYPMNSPLARYDFLFLAALMLQAVLLFSGLETLEEGKVILIYHVVGTLMELFKTATGSWIYPEPSIFHIGGVPLFTGFMYSCIGSYICRSWRLFDFRFTRHPPLWALILLSLAIYANFFIDHYGIDLRLLLFGLAALLFAHTKIHYKIWRAYRSMPLLLGLFLVSVFIWVSENIGTFTRTWLYPSQIQHGWSPVSAAKLGSWFLLLIISYTMVAVINKPEALDHSAGIKG